MRHITHHPALAPPADNGLIPFFNIRWREFLGVLVVAFNGGAYVGGDVIPIANEMAQGWYTTTPHLFNGFGLLICSAVAHAHADTPRNLMFTAAQAMLASWI
jgi:hypothetical protein